MTAPNRNETKGVPECDAADSFRGQVGVGHLEGETDGEGDVGEVEIGRGLLLVEVDSPTALPL